MRAEAEFVPEAARRTLTNAVDREYGLRLSPLEVLATGEETTSLVGMAGNRRFVVKVHDLSDPYRRLVLRFAASIAHATRLHAVICPLPTLSGEPFAELENRLLTVEPFVDATRPAWRQLSDYRRLGSVVAQIHASTPRRPTPKELSDDLQIACVDEIHDLTEAATPSTTTAEPHRRQAATALLGARASLTATGALLRALKEKVAAHPLRLVPTHGDLTEGNILVDTSGRFSLIDWTSALWAPAERDLIFFAGEPLAAFLDGYDEVRSIDELRPELFEFYILRWRLEGVAFFGRRALVSEHPRSREAYWILTRFLPAATKQTEADNDGKRVQQLLDARRRSDA